MTPAKQAALDRLPRRHKGVPQHPPPPAEFAELVKLVRQASRIAPLFANPLALRPLGRRLGVDSRTVGRWLAGTHRPSPHFHSSIRRVTQEAKSEVARLKQQLRRL